MIAPSFADIFYNNAFQNGLLPVTVPSMALLEHLKRKASSSHEIEVDLVNQRIFDAMGNVIGSFSVESHRRHGLINGLDEIDSTLRIKESISKYEQLRNKRHPWIEDCTRKLQSMETLHTPSPTLPSRSAKLQW